MKPIIEVCTGSVATARIAQEHGGGRLELCAALQLGGYTPSAGMLAAVQAAVTIPVNVIIRNHADRYLFTDEEIDVMARDVAYACANGVHGVVIGALTRDNQVDMAACKKLIAAAGGKPVTFHRAFDQVADRQRGLEELIDLGVARVLTSAGKPTVPEGLDGLEKLMEQAKDRIIIMPGGGVTAGNIGEIVRRLGCREIHGTFRAPGAPTAADTSAEQLDIAVASL